MLVTGLATAQPTEPQTLQRVDIVGTVPRDARTVGDLAEAVALFERLHDMSPQGELRFRELPRLDVTKADRLHIQVLAPAGPIDVLLDELSRFSFEPAWQALPKDTLVRSKLLDGEVAWRSDVRTPGLPDNTRRLGDLRLQCKLDVGARLARHSLTISWPASAPADALCSSFADRPVLAMDLVNGSRRERLSYFFLHGAGDSGPMRLSSGGLDWSHALRDLMFRPSLPDDIWPNDSLVEFTFIDPSALASGEVQP